MLDINFTFSSFTPPTLATIAGVTKIYPNGIEVPADTTLEEVYAHWTQELPPPAPGFRCSNEEMDLYLAGKWTPESAESFKDITVDVKSTNGKKTYTVSNSNGHWDCTCVGYGFRRKCKHITEVKLKM